jgi:hypothetical protein
VGGEQMNGCFRTFQLQAPPVFRELGPAREVFKNKFWNRKWREMAEIKKESVKKRERERERESRSLTVIDAIIAVELELKLIKSSLFCIRIEFESLDRI